MDLDSMKYAELRSLAKELGLKANVKADKLLKAIKQHYQQEENKKSSEQGGDRDVTDAQENAKATQDASSGRATFVNTRRGRGTGTKRKPSTAAAATEGGASSHPSAAEEDAAASGETSGAKKRRVSSARDPDHSQTGATGAERQQPDPQGEAPAPGDEEKAPKVTRAGRIPRLQGAQQKSKPLLKPVTPNFKKLHEAHFNKMESIDSYVQRKTKQLETYRSSVKELKQLSDKTKLQGADGKTQKTGRASMFSPAPASERAAEDRRRRTLLSASKAPPDKKSAARAESVFRPSLLSTRRINVRFSEATRDNERKRSAAKTPARMSPCVASSTPQKQSADGGKPNDAKTSTFSATKTPGPFVFTGNTSVSATPGTQQKSKFDLKASLSRPLTYKPHTGKLKPFGESNENTAANKSLISVSSHQKNYKQHRVQTREVRRTKHTENRKQKKENMLGARRGLVMM